MTAPLESLSTSSQTMSISTDTPRMAALKKIGNIALQALKILAGVLLVAGGIYGAGAYAVPLAKTAVAFHAPIKAGLVALAGLASLALSYAGGRYLAYPGMAQAFRKQV